MDRSSGASVVRIDTAEGALERLAEAHARSVVLGPDVDAPLTLARSIHGVRPRVLVTLAVEAGETALRAALLTTPLLAGPIRVDRVRREPPAADPWAALEGASDGVLLVDGAGVVLGCNPAAARFLGRTERSLLGTPFCDLAMVTERARLAAHVRDGGSGVFIAMGASPVEVVSWRWPGADPGLRTVLLRLPGQAWAERRTHELFLEGIVENIPNMIFVKEAAGLRFVQFNRAGEDLLGYGRGDLLGRNDYDFFPKAEADFFTQKDREVLAGGKVVDIPEEPIHTRAGIRWLHTRKVPILDDHGHPLFLLGISWDITRRKAEEEERARLVAELRRSNAELELFASVASHDLQEPLRKVQMFGDRLKASLGDTLTEEALDCIGRMDAAAERMQELVQGLLAYSRVTTRGEAFEAVALQEVLAEVLADLEVRILTTRGEVEVSELPVVQGDRTQMRQLFQNLVGNALKFHRPGVPPRVAVRARALPPVKNQPQQWEVEVADNGIGFDMHDAQRIFQPFQRLVGRDRYEGTGMGLAICHRIVERHGGTIMCESVPGEGSTFRVRLR